MLQGEETRVEFRNITISVPSAEATPNGTAAASCATSDSVIASKVVRARLAERVRQANANDTAGMNEVWAPGLVGWFPQASVYSDSAAYVGPASSSARCRDRCVRRSSSSWMTSSPADRS